MLINRRTLLKIITAIGSALRLLIGDPVGDAIKDLARMIHQRKPVDGYMKYDDLFKKLPLTSRTRNEAYLHLYAVREIELGRGEDIEHIMDGFRHQWDLKEYYARRTNNV